jgi:DNA-directed RNA polymerase subunit RPC12/RpoP
VLRSYNKILVNQIELHQEGNLETATRELVHYEGLLREVSRKVCMIESITFEQLSPIQRMFVTHYRCHDCGLLPLYYLDLSHIKRVRCKRCDQLLSFKSSGKYGRIRKKIAFALNKAVR